MANPEHLKILEQGVDVWNRWRVDNPKVKPDLRNFDLRGNNLFKFNLSETDLFRTKLSGVNLDKADLYHADLVGADLKGATLIEASLIWAHATKTNISNANCSLAEMFHTEIVSSNVENLNLTGAKMGWTKLGDLDLTNVIGLETIEHQGPSTIGLDTFYRSNGKISKTFLRGAGVPNNFIQYIHSLTGHAIEYYSCFISYSSKDKGFAERLYVDLQNKGVRCWYAPKDMRIGDPIRDRIDQSIRIHDKLLLILSEHSINSEWVGDEFESASEQEQRRNTTVLFPIRLDDAVMDTEKAWAAKLRKSRHIGDFTNWKDHDSYQNAFERLLRDLKSEGE